MGWCNKPKKLQFRSILKRKNLILSKHYLLTRGEIQLQRDRHDILTIYEAVHSMIVSDTYFSSGMLIIFYESPK